jgi:hypothetical protein
MDTMGILSYDYGNMGIYIYAHFISMVDNG